jgi:poly-gamma-glutamate capsule biosynthesis protein CapA/YwtB (metallophosphatase superfamily)
MLSPFRIVAIALLAAASFSVNAQTSVTDTLKNVQLNDSLQKKNVADTITVIGVGDIMMGSNYPDATELPPNEGEYLMKDVDSVLNNADVTFGNLEGVLLDTGGIAKTCKDPSVCYVFRTPVKYVKNLVKAGFDIMSVANNHAGDFGDLGRRVTWSTLANAGIQYAGQLQNQYCIFTRNGVKYGFTAFGPNTNCNDINNIDEAKKLVAFLDSAADVVIVSFHGGAEGKDYQHVPRALEMYHGEKRGDVYAFSHAMIDAGADIIFGQGPHVTRAVEVYKKRFIAYSSGNFCTYGGVNVNGVNGLSPILKVYASSKGEFYKAYITPTFQTFHSKVSIDPDKRVIKLMQDLTKEDIPNKTCVITNDGWIMPD